MREVRCEGVLRWNVALAVALALLVSADLGPPAWAVMRYGPLQLSGNVESLNMVRHSNPEKFQFIMNRNVLRLRVDWDWFKKGRLIDRFDLPFIERSNVFLMYRGAYDGFYDIAPGGPQEGQTRFDDLVGGPIVGNRPGMCVGGTCPVGTDSRHLPQLLPGYYSRFTDKDRSADKWENRLREVYIDLKLKGAPLTFRIGRQQVIWGESDQFRVMDIINPLDFSWHATLESWDELRVPLWLVKGLWDIGWLGPLSNTYVEVVYNPFDFQPGTKIDFLPRPWGAPFPDPLRQGQVSNSGGTFITPVFNKGGTTYMKGDFARNPQEASEVGARFHAVTPQGINFSLNYLYGRGRGPGGAANSQFKIEDMFFSETGDPKNLTAVPKLSTVGFFKYVDEKGKTAILPVKPINVVGKIVYPYNHIFGMTGNYYDGDYTDAVLRFETLYAMGEPYATTDPSTLVPIRALNLTPEQSRKSFGTSPMGLTKRDMWTGMLGFDRPTWIRFLNRKATLFLTGQFFWTYTTGDIDHLVGSSPVGDFPYVGNVGQWVSGKFAGLSERQQNGNAGVVGNGDNWHRWEHFLTFAANTYYRSGTVFPSIASGWDPVNDNYLFAWSIAYYYSNDFIITLNQNFFGTYGSKRPSNENLYAGGRFPRRDETGIRLTYQF